MSGSILICPNGWGVVPNRGLVSGCYRLQAASLFRS